MFDSRIFYLQMTDLPRRRPQAAHPDKRRGPRPPDRRGVRLGVGR